MEMILIREDLWDITCGEYKKPGPWFEPVSTTTTGTGSGTPTSSAAPVLASVEWTPTEEEAKQLANWNRSNKRAYATISLAVSDQCRVHISNIKDPEAMWKKLKELFEVQGYIVHYLAFKDAVNTNMERTGSVKAYIDKIKSRGQLCVDMDHTLP